MSGRPMVLPSEVALDDPAPGSNWNPFAPDNLRTISSTKPHQPASQSIMRSRITRHRLGRPQ